MSKFGELIETRVPVLLDFYAEWDDGSNEMHDTLFADLPFADSC